MNAPMPLEINIPNLNTFNRCFDVFLGAGHSLSAFNPGQNCFLNDPNTDLITFYKNIHHPQLQHELQQVVDAWNQVGAFSNFSTAEIIMAFQDLESDIISTDDISYIIRAIVLMNLNHDAFNLLTDKHFVASTDMFQNALLKSVVSALIKTKGLFTVGNKLDYQNQLSKQIETAFRSGFYEHFKNLINWQKTEIIDCLNLYKHLATWFFIKEMGKDKQLYYDNSGNLKNHYGGLNCNAINFQINVDEILDSQFLKKLEHAKLFNQNPIDFLSDQQITPGDVVIINLTKQNMVLANGKNYMGLGSLTDQVKQLVLMDINLILLTDDESAANEYILLSGNRLKLNLHNGNYLLTR